MRVREDVWANASPDRCWELVADPARHGLWNPRITRTVREGTGELRRGSRYRVRYDAGADAREFDAEVLVLEPGRRFVARLEEAVKSSPEARERWCEERYELTPRRGGTHVLHEVHVHHSGVPWPVRALVWLVMRLGRPAGATYMQRFGELAAR